MPLPKNWLENRTKFELACYAEKVLLISKLFGRYWLRLEPDDASLTPSLARDGYWEAWVSLAIARAIQPGWWCIDAGANVGYYSLLMAAQGASKVIAIEPHPGSAGLMRDMIQNNRLQETILLREIAIGPKGGNAALKVYKTDQGKLIGSSSLLTFPEYELAEEFHVNTTTLDEILAGCPQVDFIKMDIEGAEVEAWDGLSETLRLHRPIICMEVATDRGYLVGEFLKKVEGQGYVVQMINYDGDIVPLDIEFIYREKWGMVWVTKRG